MSVYVPYYTYTCQEKNNEKSPTNACYDVVFCVSRQKLARRCKSSSQRDGREVIAKRKGEITLAARRGLKEARSKDASRWTKTGCEAGSVRASWRMAAKP